jgi:hypothetical protein
MQLSPLVKSDLRFVRSQLEPSRRKAVLSVWCKRLVLTWRSLFNSYRGVVLNVIHFLSVPGDELAELSAS